MISLIKKIPAPMLIILIFTAARLFIHLLTNIFGGYGYFRDELYYIACTERLDIGYVDHPPLSIYILWINRIIFGDSIFALRLLPAVCAAAVVYLTGLITLRLNGGIPALIISLSAVVITPISLAMHSIFSMNCFDWVLWSLFFYLVIQLFISNEKKYWYLIGLVIGLGLLNKTGFLWVGAGFLAGLILTKERRNLITIHPYISGAIALLIFLPYIIWNFTHDFAHLEFIKNAVEIKYASVTPIDFITGQFLLQNPVAFPLWAAGLIFLLRSKLNYYRILAIIYLTVFMILLINGHSKAEYLSPAYPMLFASGGIWLEKLVSMKMLKSAVYPYCGLIVLIGFLLLPTVLPVLHPEEYVSYSTTIGIQPSTSEGITLQELPQHFADMHGWEELAKGVSDVYVALSDEDKASTFVFAQNYGEAGAIEFFSSKYELPKVLCPHNSYWLWDKDEFNNFDYQNVIIIGGRGEDHAESLMNVQFVKQLETKYAIPYEANAPIYLGSGFKVDIRELWERIRIYI